MKLNKAIRNILHVTGRVQSELEECARVFEHNTHAIKITAENKKYLTVYARSRTTGEKEFEGSIFKKPGTGSAYLFRSAGALNVLGVPR